MPYELKSSLKNLIINIQVKKMYLIYLILLPVAYLISLSVKKNANKNIFLAFITNLSNDNEKKYKHNYEVINSIKEAGFVFKFKQINENHKIYKKRFSNFFWFKEIIKINPNYIYFYSDYQSKGNYPSIIIFYLISKIIKCKCISISHDYIWKINYQFKRQNIKLFDVVLAQPYAYIKNNRKIKFVEPWLTSKKLYCKPNNKRKYDITFIGRVDSERLKILNQLDRDGIKVSKFGPGFNKTLSNKKYIKVLQNSKMTINFNRRKYNHNLKYLTQSKGRVLESISCGCLLLEETNRFTKKIFKCNQHYIEYKNYNDLKAKLKFYSKNFDNFGIKISTRAHKYLIKNYQPKHIWPKILKNI